MIKIGGIVPKDECDGSDLNSKRADAISSVVKRAISQLLMDGNVSGEEINLTISFNPDSTFSVSASKRSI